MCNLTRNKVIPFSIKYVLINLSSFHLNEEQEDVLKFGLTHSIVPPKICKSDIYTCFEMIHRNMLNHITDPIFLGRLKSDISHLAHQYVSSFRPTRTDLKRCKVLQDLRKNKDIIIIKPDKGNGVVILNRVDYVNGMLEILKDSTKFRLIHNDPTITREGHLQRFLRQLKSNGKIDQVIYKKMYPNGSQPARMYGLPKMHKTRPPNSTPKFRPIVSSIGAVNYNMAKFLCELLNPVLPNQYVETNSFTFVKEIQHVDTSHTCMVSFDVVSLFTNIPQFECIDIAVDYITNDVNYNMSLNRSDLRKLFLLATEKTNFIFNGDIYDQIDGVSMGSPLAPVLANLFMGHHEQTWLKNFSQASVMFYLRYVDDNFLFIQYKR
ncbi:uncharacterized protein [Antedon mediterranea]|uniref:uncharacterized protein n=1 Tax=Antedon mediterranea TaxID=105859 RepID=UPI003AF7B9FC